MICYRTFCPVVTEVKEEQHSDIKTYGNILEIVNTSHPTTEFPSRTKWENEILNKYSSYCSVVPYLLLLYITPYHIKTVVSYTVFFQRDSTLQMEILFGWCFWHFILEHFFYLNIFPLTYFLVMSVVWIYLNVGGKPADHQKVLWNNHLG